MNIADYARQRGWKVATRPKYSTPQPASSGSSSSRKSYVDASGVIRYQGTTGYREDDYQAAVSSGRTGQSGTPTASIVQPEAKIPEVNTPYIVKAINKVTGKVDYFPTSNPSFTPTGYRDAVTIDATTKNIIGQTEKQRLIRQAGQIYTVQDTRRGGVAFKARGKTIGESLPKNATIADLAREYKKRTGYREIPLTPQTQSVIESKLFTRIRGKTYLRAEVERKIPRQQADLLKAARQARLFNELMRILYNTQSETKKEKIVRALSIAPRAIRQSLDFAISLAKFTRKHSNVQQVTPQYRRDLFIIANKGTKLVAADSMGATVFRELRDIYAAQLRQTFLTRQGRVQILRAIVSPIIGTYKSTEQLARDIALGKVIMTVNAFYTVYKPQTEEGKKLESYIYSRLDRMATASNEQRQKYKKDMLNAMIIQTYILTGIGGKLLVTMKTTGILGTILRTTGLGVLVMSKVAGGVGKITVTANAIINPTPENVGYLAQYALLANANRIAKGAVYSSKFIAKTLAKIATMMDTIRYLKLTSPKIKFKSNLATLLRTGVVKIKSGIFGVLMRLKSQGRATATVYRQVNGQWVKERTVNMKVLPAEKIAESRALVVPRTKVKPEQLTWLERLLTYYADNKYIVKGGRLKTVILPDGKKLTMRYMRTGLETKVISNIYVKDAAGKWVNVMPDTVAIRPKGSSRTFKIQKMPKLYDERILKVKMPTLKTKYVGRLNTDAQADLNNLRSALNKGRIQNQRLLKLERRELVRYFSKLQKVRNNQYTVDDLKYLSRKTGEFIGRGWIKRSPIDISIVSVKGTKPIRIRIRKSRQIYTPIPLEKSLAVIPFKRTGILPSIQKVEPIRAARIITTVVNKAVTAKEPGNRFIQTIRVLFGKSWGKKGQSQLYQTGKRIVNTGKYKTKLEVKKDLSVKKKDRYKYKVAVYTKVKGGDRKIWSKDFYGKPIGEVRDARLEKTINRIKGRLGDRAKPSIIVDIARAIDKRFGASFFMGVFSIPKVGSGPIVNQLNRIENRFGADIFPLTASGFKLSQAQAQEEKTAPILIVVSSSATSVKKTIDTIKEKPNRDITPRRPIPRPPQRPQRKPPREPPRKKPPKKPPKEEPPKPPIIPRFDFKQDWFQKLPRGYVKIANPIVRIGGRNREFNWRMPVNMTLKKVIHLVDNRTAMSFQLRLVGVAKRKDIRRPSLAKFRVRRGSNRAVLYFVEKRRYAIDSPGEKSGLRINRRDMQRRKRKI